MRLTFGAIVWTPEKDYTIRRMRTAGKSWDDIGIALDVSSATAYARAKKIGLAICHLDRRDVRHHQSSSKGDRRAQLGEQPLDGIAKLTATGTRRGVRRG